MHQNFAPNGNKTPSSAPTLEYLVVRYNSAVFSRTLQFYGKNANDDSDISNKYNENSGNLMNKYFSWD